MFQHHTTPYYPQTSQVDELTAQDFLLDSPSFEEHSKSAEFSINFTKSPHSHHKKSPPAPLNLTHSSPSSLPPPPTSSSASSLSNSQNGGTSNASPNTSEFSPGPGMGFGIGSGSGIEGMRIAGGGAGSKNEEFEDPENGIYWGQQSTTSTATHSFNPSPLISSASTSHPHLLNPSSAHFPPQPSSAPSTSTTFPPTITSSLYPPSQPHSNPNSAPSTSTSFSIPTIPSPTNTLTPTNVSSNLSGILGGGLGMINGISSIHPYPHHPLPHHPNTHLIPSHAPSSTTRLPHQVHQPRRSLSSPSLPSFMQQQQQQQSGGMLGGVVGASTNGVTVGGIGLGSVGKGVGKGGSAFVGKVYAMLEDPGSEHLINFTARGDSFVISNVKEFSSEVLPKHFKHNNFSSFVRQLNMYGFHKVNKTPRGQRGALDNQVWEFNHPKFMKGRPDLLEQIKRKAIEGENTRMTSKPSGVIVTSGPITRGKDKKAEEEGVRAVEMLQKEAQDKIQAEAKRSQIESAVLENQQREVTRLRLIQQQQQQQQQLQEAEAAMRQQQQHQEAFQRQIQIWMEHPQVGAEAYFNLERSYEFVYGQLVESKRREEGLVAVVRGLKDMVEKVTGRQVQLPAELFPHQPNQALHPHSSDQFFNPSIHQPPGIFVTTHDGQLQPQQAPHQPQPSHPHQSFFMNHGQGSNSPESSSTPNKSEMGETPSPKFANFPPLMSLSTSEVKIGKFTSNLGQNRANSSDSLLSSRSINDGHSLYPMSQQNSFRSESSQLGSSFYLGGDGGSTTEIVESMNSKLSIDPVLSAGSSHSLLQPPPTPGAATGTNSPDGGFQLAIKTPLPESPLVGGNFMFGGGPGGLGMIGSDEDGEDEPIGLEMFGGSNGDGLLEVVTAPNSTYFDGGSSTLIDGHHQFTDSPNMMLDEIDTI